MNKYVVAWVVQGTEYQGKSFEGLDKETAESWAKSLNKLYDSEIKHTVIKLETAVDLIENYLKL